MSLLENHKLSHISPLCVAGDTDCHLPSGVTDRYHGNTALSHPGERLMLKISRSLFLTSKSKNKPMTCLIKPNERVKLMVGGSLMTSLAALWDYLFYFERDCCVCDDSGSCFLCEFAFGAADG